MAFETRYTPTAVNHLRKFSARQRSIILDGIRDRLTHQPDLPTRHRKPMKPNPLAAWELRLGDLGVFYDVGDDAQTVVVVAVGMKIGNRVQVGGEEIQL